METIFDHNPTQEELDCMDNEYSGPDKEKYLEDLNRRAEVFKSSVEYEATCDMQHLSKLRNDQQGLKKYTKILDDKFVIFQGTDYDTDRDEDYDAEIEAHPATKHSGIDEIIFEQLSGNANIIGDIILTDSTGKTSVISINSEGQILWTN